MNFEFKGTTTFEDYLRMVRRLSYRNTFIALIGGLIIAKIAFTLFKFPDLWLYILAILYVLLIAVNFFIIVPWNSRKKFDKNTLLSQERTFKFYDGMTLEFPIYKIAYYDDAIYISSLGNQAMIIKKDWLQNDQSWDDFTKFMAEKIAPQITPKLSRR